MNPQDYIGPQFQLSPPVQPDYALLAQALGKLGHQLGELCIAAWNGCIACLKPLIDVFVNAWSDFGPAPTHSRLRLPCHRTQYEKRIAWKLVHPAMPKKINAKRRMIVQRKMILA